VIVRDGKVLLVHRASYDDWTLPKGKLEPGESWETAALREIEEETGLRCTLGAEAGRTYYTDARGRPKEVRFFWMSSSGEPAPAHEIDAVRWVALAQAAAELTYPSDRGLLATLEPAAGAPDATPTGREE
jgi:8-oxo-dGTP diphosphatase